MALCLEAKVCQVVLKDIRITHGVESFDTCPRSPEDTDQFWYDLDSHDATRMTRWRNNNFRISLEIGYTISRRELAEGVTTVPRFSERMGFRPVKSVIQVDSMDADLRTSLWNVLTLYCWNRLVDPQQGLYTRESGASSLAIAIWRDFMKLPLQDIPMWWSHTLEYLRQYYFGLAWDEVYDFVEFVAQSFGQGPWQREFIDACNKVLERELSGYRFVGDEIVPITNEQEIEAIDTAIGTAQTSNLLNPVALHLKAALSALADRSSPDYRTSVKESISAVEAICQRILGDDKATLGAALARIESQHKLPMHHNLKEAFNQLYKYTSDADGIRHAMKDEPNVDIEDALFMLVSCSAFVNYLIAKAEKAGIDLKGK